MTMAKFLLTSVVGEQTKLFLGKQVFCPAAWLAHAIPQGLQALGSYVKAPPLLAMSFDQARAYHGPEVAACDKL
jgi:hypothetical protein